MSWRVTIVLAVLVVATALFVFTGEDSKQPPGAEIEVGQPVLPTAPTPGQRILDVSRDTIAAITIIKGDRRVEALRHHGTWGTEATARVVEGLLDDVLGLRTLDEIDVPANQLADYGLQPSQAILEVKHGNDQSIRLSIGKHNPSATAVYTCFDDNGPVYLVGALLAWKLDSAVQDLGAVGK